MEPPSQPPGGDDYVNPSPEPGGVRDTEPPADVLERQSELVKKQAARAASA